MYTPGKGLALGNAKSEMSNRDIPLMYDNHQMLRNRYKICHEGFVFTFKVNPEEPVFPDSITQFLNGFSKRYDLPHISPHMLRRTLPTLLITKYNIDPKTLQAILGHSNISTTLGYYTMVYDDQKKRTLEMYGRITGGFKEAKKNTGEGVKKKNSQNQDNCEYIDTTGDSQDYSILARSTSSRA
mgnify:CR=1 FL=1